MNFRRKIGIALIALVAFGLALAPLANADPQLAVTDGTNTSIIACPTGNCTFIGAVGGWTVNVVTGIASPPSSIPGEPLPFLDLVFSDTHSGSVLKSLYILWTDDDLGIVPPVFSMIIGGTNNHTTTTYSTFFDTGDVEFGRPSAGPATVPGGLSGTAHSINVLGPFSAAAYNGATTGPGPGGSGPYSLTEMIVLTPGRASSSGGGNAELQGVPEPATMLLLGSGLIGLAGYGRKKFFKK